MLRNTGQWFAFLFMFHDYNALCEIRMPKSAMTTAKKGGEMGREWGRHGMKRLSI